MRTEKSEWWPLSTRIYQPHFAQGWRALSQHPTTQWCQWTVTSRRTYVIALRLPRVSWVSSWSTQLCFLEMPCTFHLDGGTVCGPVHPGCLMCHSGGARGPGSLGGPSSWSPTSRDPSHFPSHVRGPLHGAQNDYTHIFIVWELLSQLHRTSATQGLLAGILLCNSALS